VRQFFCANRACERAIFTAPVPELAARYARKTDRLQEALSLIGYALGGEAGARLATELGLLVSPDTLLNRVRQVGVTAASQSPVRVVGGDDWAFKKGCRYGTVLVDRERHRLRDLLPDRSAESLSAWLRHHPEAEIVSRDRASAYAAAARDGAPQAKQVADRFHLLKNTGDLLERVLTRHYRQLQETTSHLAAEQAAVAPVPASAVEQPRSPRPPTQEEQDSASRRERRLARYERVVELHQQGYGQRALSRKTGLARNTVRTWLEAGTFPEQAPRPPRSSKLTPFVADLRQRWSQEARSGVQLFAEIQAQGFTGRIALVQRCIQSWRAQSRASPQRHREEPPAPRTVLWRLLGYFSKTDTDLRQKQTQFVEHLCQLCREVKTVQELARRFTRMVKERCSSDLDAWLAEAKASRLGELKSFAKSLLQDYAAVGEALTSEYSNGQVEGQVNRLKLIKRSMYGRARFDLLRARVLPMHKAA
jgi:transposase